MTYYLGLDYGGTKTKAALFDSSGWCAGVETIDTETITPCTGFVECDMDTLWINTCIIIRRLIKKSGIVPQKISGIGICGHGKGLYLWGKDNHPVRNGILSADNRAWGYSVKWRSDKRTAGLNDITIQPFIPSQQVCLLAWLRDHEAGSLEQTKWVFSCKDYIRFRLTGLAQAEITDFSGSGLMDLRKREFSDCVLKSLGLSEISHALPPLCEALEIVGEVTQEAALQCGLNAGTPVIGGMFDIDACALAANIMDLQSICMIAGTWSINEYLWNMPILGSQTTLNSLSFLPDYYLIEESSPTSAANSEWFIQKFLSELATDEQVNKYNIYEVANEWAAEFKPADRVPIFLPFLYGSNAHPQAKASFIGLCAAHTRKHMLRGIYEGVAFSHRWHLERLRQSNPEVPKNIRLVGGAARSAIWTQIFADVCNCPIQIIKASEAGALGCAIAVAAAVKDYPSLKEAATHMSVVSDTIFPVETAVSAYNKKYSLYCKIISCLDDFWTDWNYFV